MVGIHGLGGVGKTTIAKAIYNRIANCFELSCYLKDVREKSGTNDDIIKLQEMLLSKISQGTYVKVDSVPKGIIMIKERLCRTRLFLILDNVDESEVMVNLLGECNWLALGSRVIIATRDKQVLTTFGKDHQIYERKELNQFESHELFNMYTFQKIELEKDYSEVAEQIIHYANGLPLALKIIGSNLCGKSICEWKSALEKYKNIPHEKIQEKLKISYDGHGKTEKDIFLDIACFFKGFNRSYVVSILEACKLYPGYGIGRLVDKCLITVGQSGNLWMHDLLQQMGREIVQQESEELGKRSRIWCFDDAYEILTTNMGSSKIRGIMCYSPQLIRMPVDAKAFEKMKYLKILMVPNVCICEELKYLPNGLTLLQWPEFPFSLPSKYYPQQLVALEMSNSLIRLERTIKLLQKELNEGVENIVEQNQGDAYREQDMKSNDVRMVGIHGLGGVGKTTIAKAIYNRIANCFELSCYLKDVREKSGTNDDIIKLQEMLFSKISQGTYVKVDSVPKGIIMIKERLCRTRLLLILDNVDESEVMGFNRSYVVSILEACKLYPGYGIGRLIGKCLITVGQSGNLWMHDLLQQMGREIVQQESEELGKRSRIWCFDDAYEILSTNMGSSKIRGIMCYSPQLIRMPVDAKAFEKMKYLKFLMVPNVCICEELKYLPNGLTLLQWPEFPFSLPSKYYPQQLVALEMSNSLIRLERTIKLVHEFVGFLHKLQIWKLRGCGKLQILPNNLKLKSLNEFVLMDCLGLEKFPNIDPEMKCLGELNLCGSGIGELPSSIKYLTRLYSLDLKDCKILSYLPDDIYKLQLLTILDIPTAKLRQTSDYFDGFSRIGFLMLDFVSFRGNKNISELD
ncbi:disease resistance-like protein DSC1 [Quercus suber]|uniref:disease resistance-like protein DSC1 n=1 Tax=Quercus suber TaxID=58331 RepID=UPI0032DE4954